MNRLALAALLGLALSGCGAADVVQGSPGAAAGGGEGAIVVSDFATESAEIFSVGPDGTGRARLTDSGKWGSACWPAVSGDGGRIAYFQVKAPADPEADLTAELYAMNRDGSGQVHLGTGGTSGCDDVPSDGGLAFSSDGTRILVAMEEPGRSRNDVYVMNADGSARKRLTHGNAVDPVWSPDGTRIAFANEWAETSGVFVMNADGSGQKRLTGPGGGPVFSPDGTRIAYHGWDGKVAALHLMNADGTGSRRLGELSADDFAFSPDGTRIVYSGWDGSGVTDLYAVGVDGSGAVRLTEDGGSGAVFSPDGEQIAYMTDDRQVWVMDADGSGKARVTTGLFPAWAVG